MSVYTHSITREVQSVAADGVLLTEVASTAEVSATQSTWFWSSGTLYVNAPGGVDPGTLDMRVMAGETYRWALTTLPDQANYYGGLKEARLAGVDQIVRAASGDEGDVQGVSFGFSVADYPDADGDRLISGILDTEGRHFLYGRTAIVYTVSDEDRRLAYANDDDGTTYPARVLARGVIASLKPQGFVWQVRCQDEFTYRYGPQRDQDQIPRRRLSRDFYADLPEDMIGQPEPFWYGELTDVGTGDSPGNLTATAQLNDLAAVSNFAGSVSAGGSGPLGTYYYIIVALKDGEMSQLSSVVDVTLTASANRQVDLTWDTYDSGNADKLLIFRSHLSNFAQFVWAEVDPSDTSFSDEYVGNADVQPDQEDENSPWLQNVGRRMNVRVAVWAQFSDGTYGRPSTIAVDTFGAGISQGRGYFAPIPKDDDGSVTVDSSWSAVTGAVGYRYMRWRSFYSDDGAMFDFSTDLDAATTSYSDTFTVTRLGRTPLETPTATEQVRGVVPLRKVGERSIGGKRYSILLVAGHACADPPILDIYYSTAPDQTQQNAFTEDLGSVRTFKKVRSNEYGSGKNWRAPGKTDGVPEAAGYIDRTSSVDSDDIRRYTEVYCALDPLPDQIFADINGTETVGDGTGDLITDLAEQYAHCFDNYLEGNYQTGDYPTDVPRYDDGLPKRDRTRFSLVTTRGVAKFPPDGLTAAWGAGTAGFESALNLMAMLNRSGELRSFWTKDLAFAIDLFLPDDVDNAPLYTDTRDIFEGTFDAELRDDELHNVVPYRYRRNWGTGKYEGTGEVRDETSITGYGDGEIESVAPTRDLGALRDGFKAQEIAEDYALLHADPPAKTSMQVGWRGLSEDVCDLIQVTHKEGPVGEDGYASTPVQILVHEVMPLDFTVTMKGRNVGRLVDDWEAQTDTRVTEAELARVTEAGERRALEG